MMNNKPLIWIYVALGVYAFGFLSVHILNNGLDMERDKTIIVSYSALFILLLIGCVSIVKRRKQNG